MSGRRTPDYKVVSWEEVRKNCPDAYKRFRDDVCALWLKDDQLRVIFSFLVDVKRKHPTPEQVMELFTVRAKHNWRWIGARTPDNLLGLLVGARMKVFPVEYTVNAHRSWWS